VLPVLAMGATLLFVRMLYAISTHFSRYDRFLRGIGVLTLVSALTYAIDRSAADKIGAAVMLVATTTGLIATLLSWRGNSRIWHWLMAAYLPQYLCLLRMMFESLGWLPIWWELRYAMSLSVALSVPILVFALDEATHGRKERELRARHLPTQDALTGLLTRDALVQELDTAYQRVIDQRDPIALVLVRVVNYEHIRQGLGDQVAENSLLRAVVKLHRILRDVDPAGRVGAGDFGLLLDGVMTRQALTERMVQLIGSGLIPLPGLHPPITLQFHAACVLLHENPVPPEEALAALQALLEGMSNHTRRPIRFLEAPQTLPIPLAGSSSLP
jgi:GGDEF domain-containing protein